MSRSSPPSPAIVTREAARAMPRWMLLLLCAAYVLPGYFGREPWRNEDLSSFGTMLALAEQAQGQDASWLTGVVQGTWLGWGDAWAYRLGAGSIAFFSGWLPADLAARLPSIAALLITLVALWYAVYALARAPAAQPVAFAFGGEASPVDYARAVADAALLALMATLGLAQLAHEITPTLIKLAGVSLLFYGAAALLAQPLRALVAGVLGMMAMVFSGVAFTAVLLSAGALTLHALHLWQHWKSSNSLGHHSLLSVGRDPGLWQGEGQALALKRHLAVVLALTVSCAAFGLWLFERGALRLETVPLFEEGRSARDTARLWLWFIWPVWPFALWAVLRWWRQWMQPAVFLHVSLPLFFALTLLGVSLLTGSSDRSLMLALPALACLAALALPTLRRTLSALIDWFTLLFFTACAITIWVVWLSLHTGVPAQPAQNVMRLLPGYEMPAAAVGTALLALAVTLAWFWLVRWRTQRHRSALWKSLVLPAGGMVMCWALVMTLWLPILDYARSEQALVARVRAQLGSNVTCLQNHQIAPAQLTALHWYGRWSLKTQSPESVVCPWLLVPNERAMPVAAAELWQAVTGIRRPSDKRIVLWLYKASSESGGIVQRAAPPGLSLLPLIAQPPTAGASVQSPAQAAPHAMTPEVQAPPARSPAPIAVPAPVAKNSGASSESGHANASAPVLPKVELGAQDKASGGDSGAQ